MRNKFKDKCFKCEKEVLPGCGFFQRAKLTSGKGIWLVRCVSCVGTGNKIKQK